MDKGSVSRNRAVSEENKISETPEFEIIYRRSFLWPELQLSSNHLKNPW
jgi:hypothetical protein